MARAIPDPPILGERNSRSLRALLMPSVLPTPQDAHPGSFKCQRPKCVICQQHLVEGHTFTSQRTGETFHIRHQLTCTTPNLIYILHCNKCTHTQYVGETGGTLKQRFYLHRSNIKTNKNMCPLITEHFNQPNHSLLDLRCMPIEISFTDNTSRRRKREQFWVSKLRTLTPDGLNTK